MRYIRSLIIILGLLFGLSAFGQTQKGYVKTLGRPNQKGVPLSGVSVRVKGEHNPVLSKEDGTLTMLLTDKKKGDAYTLREVQKKGYELNEPGIIGRQYAYSDKVSLTIVMVSSAQLQANKQRIENNAYKVAEKNYKAKLNLLERKKEENAISEEQFRKELIDLQDKFEKYQLLIDGLAEHYAHVDYDELNEKEREVNISIENGELEKADSLIKTMFDPIDVLKRNKEALVQLNQQISEANTIIDKANEDMAAVLKQQEKDANYLYQLYTIALSRFDNDKARQYIETRAQLDSSNVKWQNDAGLFVDKYFANYPLALSYYQLALRQLNNQYEDYFFWKVVLYKNIAEVYSELADYANALLFSEDALDAIREVRGDEDPSIALLYDQIGAIYAKQNDYNTAMKYYLKACDIYEKTNVIDNKALANLYNSMGYILDEIGNYPEALNCYKKALELEKMNDNEYKIATTYNNIASVYSEQANYSKALDYCEQALEIEKKVYGIRHPSVATSLNNIGIIYMKMGNSQQGVEYLEKAHNIYVHVLGNIHPRIAVLQNNLGLAYHNLGLISKAKSCYDTALEILLKVPKCDESAMALTYNNVGGVLNELGNYIEAIENHKNALIIRERLYGNEHPNVAESYHNLGCAYKELEEYSKALDYFKKALSIYKKSYGEIHPNVADSYNSIGYIYYQLKDYSKAIVFYEKALLIREQTLGSDHLDVAESYNNIGSFYEKTGNYNNALLYYKKALTIANQIYGEFHYIIASIYGNIGSVYEKQCKFNKSLNYSYKALKICRQLLGEDHVNTGHSYYNIGHIYEKQGNNKEALNLYHKALCVFSAKLGLGDIITKTVAEEILKLEYEEALRVKDLTDFLSKNVFIATIQDGDTPAKRQGMSGEYILLKFNDWNQETLTSLFDKNKELRDEPKIIVMLKEGKISQYHFKNAIGARLGIKYVGKEERVRINKAYEEWKKQNRKQ